MAEKKTLLSMGFSHSLVEMAWKKHGNFDAALNDLISFSDSIPEVKLLQFVACIIVSFD